MNTQELLEQLLSSGKTYLEKGQQYAEDALSIPESGETRDAKLDGLKKGALAAGGLALLLGTGGGRRLTGAALRLGSLAALGGIAYKTYQGWQAGNDAPDTPVHELEGSAAQTRQALLLRAMIAAAKADGHLDDQERARIDEHIIKMGLSDTERSFLQAELERPLDPHAIAADSPDKQTAAEVYLVSRLVIDRENDDEREYLEQLAAALGLNDEEISSLEANA